jgi:hypothetical protein
VPAHFRQSQSTFGGARTLLTAKVSFGFCESGLERSKALWKPQNTLRTVPALFTPI